MYSGTVFLLRHSVYRNGGKPSEVVSRNTKLDNSTATTTAIATTWLGVEFRP